jgi:hypothetical protein
MGSWIVAALMSAAMSPEALAASREVDCQVEEPRRAEGQRIEPAPNPAAASAVARREAPEAPARPAFAERRRSGKPVPDAELIGRRRVL